MISWPITPTMMIMTTALIWTRQARPLTRTAVTSFARMATCAGFTAVSWVAGLSSVKNAKYVWLSDVKWQQREERRVDAFQHASVNALLQVESTGPGGSEGMFCAKRQRLSPDIHEGLSARQRRLRRHDKLSSLAYDDGDLDDDRADDGAAEDLTSQSAATLALSLLVPVLSARGLLESEQLKQTFRHPHLTALNRTALALIESEHEMYGAIGRCFGSMERFFEAQPHCARSASGSTDGGERIDTMDGVPPLTNIHSLFVTPEGLRVPAHDQHESGEEMVLSADEQRDILYGGLECLNELYADSREYMERLEDVRLMLADVKRNRTQMWDVLRRWALQREAEDFEARQRYRRSRVANDGQFDSSVRPPREESALERDMEAAGRPSNEWTSSQRSRGKRRVRS